MGNASSGPPPPPPPPPKTPAEIQAEEDAAEIAKENEEKRLANLKARTEGATSSTFGACL